MKRKRQDWLHIGSGKSYAHRVHQPLQSLVFITPLLLFYQLGSVLNSQTAGLTDGGSGAPVHVVAFILLLKFFSVFGAFGNVLPLGAVVAILLAWHLARKDPWDFDPKLYLGMAGEAFLWGIPFFVIGLALARHVLLQGWAGGMPMAVTADATPLGWRAEVILSVGAGIYEELLFRLITITLLNMILVDAFEMPLPWAITIIMVTSSLLFSGYHYLGNEHFNAATFVFRATLGMYLAGLFVFRGFGITVGAHTTYDLLVVGFTHLVLHKT